MKITERDRERIRMTIRSAITFKIAFKNVEKLDKIINEYNENPIKYEQDHPDFDLEETKRIRQEFLDAFDNAFTKLREANTDAKH